MILGGNSNWNQLGKCIADHTHYLTVRKKGIDIWKKRFPFGKTSLHSEKKHWNHQLKTKTEHHQK